MALERLTTHFRPFATKPETTNLSLLQQLSNEFPFLVLNASTGNTMSSARDCMQSRWMRSVGELTNTNNALGRYRAIAI